MTEWNATIRVQKAGTSRLGAHETGGPCMRVWEFDSTGNAMCGADLMVGPTCTPAPITTPPTWQVDGVD